MFDYYEIGRILSCSSNPDVVGKEGYVAGESYEDEGPVEGYGVYIFECREMEKPSSMTTMAKLHDSGLQLTRPSAAARRDGCEVSQSLRS